MAMIQFNTAGIPTKQKKIVEIENLGGVDVSSSPLSVSSNRATYISNFIKKNGVNEKRNGWEEVAHLGNGSQEINGVYIIKAIEDYSGTGYSETDVEVSHVVVHIGGFFYRTLISDNETLNDEGVTYDSIENATFTDLGYALYHYGFQYYPSDIKSFGVVGNDKLYIWAGTLFIYATEDADIHTASAYYSYMPTTTISIPCNDAASDYIGTTIVGTVNEDVNLLTPYRINTLIGEPSGTSATTFEFTLDTAVKEHITVEDLYYISVIANGVTLTQQVGASVNDYHLESDAQTLVLEANHIPTSEGVPNITVTFTAASTSSDIDLGDCTFGVQYGFDGAKDRLFISGHEKYPNVVWHNKDTTQGDYAYFSDLDYHIVGNQNYAVKGFTLLADGTLAIIKEESEIEPTAYYITPQLIPALDSAGDRVYDVDNNLLYEEGYPMTFGNIGEGMINSYSGLTLAGDSLFLSKNGVFAIESKINTTAIERYSKERSRLINKELTAYDLSTAATIVYDNKYYIAIDNKCYILDARHKTKLPDDLVDTWEYECWIWDNIPAINFFIFDDALYFGTSEGHICKFSDTSYQDITKTVLASGELVLDITTQQYTINSAKITALEVIDNGDKLYFESGDTKLYCDLLNNVQFTTSGNVITANEDIGTILYNDYEIYVDNIVGTSNLVVTTQYYVGDISNDNKSFSLYKYSDDSIVVLQDETFDIRYLMPDETEITNLQNSDGILKDDCYYDEELEKWYFLNDDGTYSYEVTNDTFNVFETDNEVVDYNGTTPTNVVATLKFYDNVECVYITRMFDLGTTLFSKTIEKLVITPDVLSGSSVSFGYETLKKKVDTLEASQVSALDFDNILFDEINFDDDDIAKSYIKKVRVRNVNFVRFIFKNDSDTNCKVNNLTILYSITKENKGVK